MKNRLGFLLIIIFLSCCANAQVSQGVELGVCAGASYYMGDINLYKQFYSPHPNGGVMVKYHFDLRNILKVGGFFTHLSANDKDFKDVFHQMRNASFSTPFFEINLMYEVNFLQYILGQTRKCSWTPYLSAGIGVYVAAHSNQKLGAALPMTFGFKKNLSRHLIIGIEWSFHKLFSDQLDNLTGEDINKIYSENHGSNTESGFPNKQHGFRFNQDWQVCALITLSYSFRIGGITCNAY
jgi:hypothetical protein